MNSLNRIAYIGVTLSLALAACDSRNHRVAVRKSLGPGGKTLARAQRGTPAQCLNLNEMMKDLNQNVDLVIAHTRDYDLGDLKLGGADCVRFDSRPSVPQKVTRAHRAFTTEGFVNFQMMPPADLANSVPFKALMATEQKECSRVTFAEGGTPWTVFCAERESLGVQDAVSKEVRVYRARVDDLQIDVYTPLKEKIKNCDGSVNPATFERRSWRIAWDKAAGTVVLPRGFAELMDEYTGEYARGLRRAVSQNASINVVLPSLNVGPEVFQRLATSKIKDVNCKP